MVTIIVYYFFGSVIRAKRTFLTYMGKKNQLARTISNLIARSLG